MLTTTHVRIVVAVLVMAVTLGCSSFQAHYRVPWEKKQEEPLTIIPEASCLSVGNEGPIDYGDNPPPKKINVDQQAPAPVVPVPVLIPSPEEKGTKPQEGGKEKQEKRQERREPSRSEEGPTAIALR